MSFRYKWIENNFYVKFYGKINFSYALMEDLNSKWYGSIRFEYMKYSIFDYRHVDELNISKEHIKMISCLDRSASRWNMNLKLAIIAKDEVMHKGMSLYLKLMKDIPWDIKIFYNLNDAIKWCNE